MSADRGTLHMEPWGVDIPANACKASNTKHLSILDDGHRARGTLELLAAHQSGLVEHRCSTGRCHDE